MDDLDRRIKNLITELVGSAPDAIPFEEIDALTHAPPHRRLPGRPRSASPFEPDDAPPQTSPYEDLPPYGDHTGPPRSRRRLVVIASLAAAAAAAGIVVGVVHHSAHRQTPEIAVGPSTPAGTSPRTSTPPQTATTVPGPSPNPNQERTPAEALAAALPTTGTVTRSAVKTMSWSDINTALSTIGVSLAQQIEPTGGPVYVVLVTGNNMEKSFALGTLASCGIASTSAPIQWFLEIVDPATGGLISLLVRVVGPQAPYCGNSTLSSAQIVHLFDALPNQP
jgi:hypothetical protein